MKIGNYEISVLETGTFGLDGGAMFGIIPKPLWEKNIPADDKNRITLGARCLLLESDSKKILVETGMGNLWQDKFLKIYKIDYSKYSLINSLADHGLSPEDISDVLLTHLHFDHTGGSTKLENDKLVPTFPNATYYVQRKQFEWACNPSERDKGSYVKNTFHPIYENGLMSFIEGNVFFDDNIELITIDGHTLAQQMVKISDSSNTYLFCGDLIPTMYHIPIPYVMGYDIQPLKTVAEKNKYLQLAVDKNWKIIFGHDNINICSSVKLTDKGYTFDQFSEWLF